MVQPRGPPRKDAPGAEDPPALLVTAPSARESRFDAKGTDKGRAAIGPPAVKPGPNPDVVLT